MTRFLRRNGVEVDVVNGVRRNASGTELFVYLFDTPTNRFSVVKITTNGLSLLTAPGRGAVFGSGGNFVTWGGETGNVVHFRSGQSLELPKFALFDVDPGGTYFVVGEKPNKTWLGRVDSPEKRAVVADDMLPSGIFLSNGSIYVTGHSYTQEQSRQDEPRTTCLILKENGEDFRTVEHLYFDWADGIAEVDPFSGRLLLLDRALISHSAYLYDLATKQRHRIGTLKNFEFFLSADLLN